MKTRLLSLAFCCGMIHLSAQITITNADMPSQGDSIRVSYATGTTANYSSAGPNMLWDFSSLVPNAQQMIHYDAPTALPFNIISTLSTLNPTPDSLPVIGTVPSNFTDYYKVSSGSYRQNGLSFEYAAITTFAIPVIYSSSDYIFRFPLQYGNQDSCDAAYSFNIPNLAYIGQTSHRVNEVDGWGALITPYGIFNCVRVKSVFNATDTVSLDTLGNGFSIPRPTMIEYKWLANGMKIPVLEVDVQLVLNNEVVSNVIYQDSLRDSLFQVGIAPIAQTISDAQVFPNPSSGNCTVSYRVSNAGNVGIFMTDLSGRRVKTIENGFESKGEHAEPINVAGLNSGMYFLEIISGSSVTVKKIVVGD